MMKLTKNKVLKAGWSLTAILFFCLILTPASLQARELSEQEIRAAVETWVRYVTADARVDAVVEQMEPHFVDGIIVAYIAHLADSGFCLCGVDDMQLPVHLYSPSGYFDPQYPAYQYFLTGIANNTQTLRNAQKSNDPVLDKYRTAFEERQRYWTHLASGDVPERKAGIPDGPNAVTLDLTSVWHQGSPYNDLCPELTPGADEHCVIGCVAGSVAAIMRYWEWPITGVGNETRIYYYRWRNTWDEEPLATNPGIPANWGGGGRLEWTATGGGRLRMNGYWDGSVYGAAREISNNAAYLIALENLYNRLTSASKSCFANFGTTTYQWSLMQDVHTEPPDAADTAVAILCYHAGVACEMGYGVWGSGAGADSAVTAYRNNFRYDDDAEYVVKDTGLYAAGVNDMINEIQWLRPIQYYGWEMAHSWILFAYNRTFLPDSIQFGMNSVNGAIDWVSWENTYPYANHCFIHYIAPENVKFVGAASLGDGSPDDPYRDIQEAVVEAPDNSILIFKAGSDNTFSAPTLTITRPLTLRGRNVTIRKD